MPCARFRIYKYADFGTRFNGKLIEDAFGLRGYTAEAFAVAAGIPLPRLRTLVDAQDEPTLDEQSRTCFVTGLPIRFFFREGPVSEAVGFVCGEDVQSCQHCGFVADYLCDYPIGDGKTCDLPLCKEHRTRLSDDPEIDFCPVHAKLAGMRERE